MLVNINEYIVISRGIYGGTVQDYLEKAEELADEKKLPVLFERAGRQYIVLPFDVTDAQ